MTDLKIGSKGKDVIAVQKALVALGIKPTVRPNGTFDKTTDEAVRAFQKKHGLKVDGTVGKNTRGKIEKLTSGRKMDLKSNVADYAALIKKTKKDYLSVKKDALAVITSITRSKDPATKKIAKEYMQFFNEYVAAYMRWGKQAEAVARTQKAFSAALRNDPWTAEDLKKQIDRLDANAAWEMRLMETSVDGFERLDKALRKTGMPLAA